MRGRRLTLLVLLLCVALTACGGRAPTRPAVVGSPAGEATSSSGAGAGDDPQPPSAGPTTPTTRAPEARSVAGRGAAVAVATRRVREGAADPGGAAGPAAADHRPAARRPGAVPLDHPAHRPGGAGPDGGHLEARLPGRPGRPALCDGQLPGVRRPGPHRRAGRARAGRRRGRLGVRPALPGPVPDRGDAAGHRGRPEGPPTGDGNNTAAFVCRAARKQTRWSAHAYGLAVDVNPFQNPYRRGDLVLPELAGAYLDRDRRRPGMVRPGDVVTTAFADLGWTWGGTWRSPRT